MIRVIKRLLVGYDTFERHRLAASLVNRGAARILDVGGGAGLLDRFTSTPIVVTNLREGDVLSSAMSLPFLADSFDAVTCLDVLEHVPPADRPRLILELVRVAKTQVILSAPFGSAEHSQQEHKLLAELSALGQSNTMLAEHVAFGLPTPQAVVDNLPTTVTHDVFYMGDFRFNLLLFKSNHWHGAASFRLLKGGLAVILNLLGNLAIYPMCRSSQPRPFTNRMTFAIFKRRYAG